MNEQRKEQVNLPCLGPHTQSIIHASHVPAHCLHPGVRTFYSRQPARGLQADTVPHSFTQLETEQCVMETRADVGESGAVTPGHGTMCSTIAKANCQLTDMRALQWAAASLGMGTWIS